MNNSERVCLGAIVGVHGIKGEVKVKSFTEVDTDIDQYGVLESEDGSKKFQIKVVGHSKEILRVKIKGVDDRNLAETYVGNGLYVKRSLLPETSEDEFYYEDLIGLIVKQPDSEEIIGNVNAIYNFGAGDLLEIKMNDGTTEMQPFSQKYVPVVNIKDGYIIVNMIHFAEGEEEAGVES